MTGTVKNVICVLGLFSLCFLGIPIRVKEPDSVEHEFLQFIQKHNKSYSKDSAEYEKRLSYFKASHSRAKQYNILHNQSNDHARFGITKYSDLEPAEFQEMREKNVVTSVKNQHNCGACWAFSTVETIESMHAIKNGELKELSTQEVIDCAKNGNMGCLGGDTCTALSWMATSNVSLLEESDYPLTLKQQRCRIDFRGSPSEIQLEYFSCFNLVDNEDQLKRILAFHGPVTAAVDAVTWQDYLGGIIQYHCRDHTNHAVQIVGYDARGPIPFYIVRNSWGVDFGNEGYLHIAIGKNLCGIAREVSALDVVA